MGLAVSTGKSVIIQQLKLGDDTQFLNLCKLQCALQHNPSLARIPVEDKFGYLQKLYITSGCDYVSFWSGHGKVSFLHALFNNAEFISDSDLPGKLPDNNDASLLSFFRLVGYLYFKRAASENKELTKPIALYNEIRVQSHELLQQE